MYGGDMKITALCMSSTIQRTAVFERLCVDEVTRSVRYRLDASGKAVNAARVLNQLEKGCVTLICPAGKENKAEFSAMAKKDGARIVPTGLFAQYQLGLTQQVPMNVVYLTDGVSRTIDLGEGKIIKFKRASPRYFAIRSRLALLLTMALKDWKVENLTKEQVALIKAQLNANPRFQATDLKLMTSKVREFIISLYE